MEASRIRINSISVDGMSSPTLTPEQIQALQGWGTGLTSGLVDRNGQKFGGDKTLDQFVDNLNAQFPGLNASIEDVTGGDSGTYIGSKVNFDQSKLPEGWQQALGGTGRVELSDPNSKWGQGQGTLIKNPYAVTNDPTWGKYTSMSNIYEQPDKAGDVGFWGPLAVGAAIGGAGAGWLSGFNGMSNGAAQGLVSGATGSSLGGGSFAGIPGLSPTQTLNTGMTIGRDALSGNKTGMAGAGLSAITSALGLPKYVSPLLNLGIRQAINNKGPQG